MQATNKKKERCMDGLPYFKVDYSHVTVYYSVDSLFCTQTVHLFATNRFVLVLKREKKSKLKVLRVYSGGMKRLLSMGN